MFFQAKLERSSRSSHITSGMPWRLLCPSLQLHGATALLAEHSPVPGAAPPAGVMFSATQTVQLLYRCVLRLLGTPCEHAAAEEAFAQSAAWGASVEAILVARGVVLSSLASEADEAGPAGATQAAALEAEAWAAAEAAPPMRGD